MAFQAAKGQEHVVTHREVTDNAFYATPPAKSMSSSHPVSYPVSRALDGSNVVAKEDLECLGDRHAE